MSNILKKAAAGLLMAGVAVLSGCSLFGGGGEALTKNPLTEYDYSKMHFVQFDEPTEGQKMAVIETDLGTIKAVLYPEYAPKTVTNFINRANDGFYNGKDVYCILEKALFMTGAADEKKNSGFTDDGQLIENEYSVDLWPFRGALCAFSGHVGYADSRFFVVNKREITAEQETELRSNEIIPGELVDKFIEKGCVVDFSGVYTVFGQTIEGFDVIEKICGLEICGDLQMPVDPVYIKSITISEYHAE